jgi:hypothetical protein
VVGNESDILGGGMTLYVVADTETGDGSQPTPASARLTVANELIAENTASGEGGGLGLLLQAFGDATASVSIDLSTIAANEADEGGSGIELQTLTDTNVVGTPVEGEALLSVSDSIIADNTGGYGIGGARPGVEGPVFGDPGTGNVHATVSYSDLFGNDSGAIEPTLTSLTPPPTPAPVVTETANLAVDPQLDADGPDNQPGTGDDYAHGMCVRIGRVSSTSLADVNRDALVDGVDLLRISVAFGSEPQAPRFTPLADLDGDGIVDGDDLALTVADLSQSCP